MDVEKRDVNGSQVPTIPISAIPETENSNEKKSNKRPIPSLEATKIQFGRTFATSEIDSAVRENAIESDRAYRKITEEIIKITGNQLGEHNKDKKPLRRDLLDFVKGLLATQFGVLAFFMLVNDVLPLNISDNVIEVYIVSVFVETLAGLIIMIRYAFDSTQEVELIKILNEIITHFKKYDEK